MSSFLIKKKTATFKFKNPKTPFSIVDLEEAAHYTHRQKNASSQEGYLAAGVLLVLYLIQPHAQSIIAPWVIFAVAFLSWFGIKKISSPISLCKVNFNFLSQPIYIQAIEEKLDRVCLKRTYQALLAYYQYCSDHQMDLIHKKNKTRLERILIKAPRKGKFNKVEFDRVVGVL